MLLTSSSMKGQGREKSRVREREGEIQSQEDVWDGGAKKQSSLCVDIQKIKLEDVKVLQRW